MRPTKAAPDSMLHDTPLTKAPFIGVVWAPNGPVFQATMKQKKKGKLISLFIIFFFVLEGSQCVRDMQVDGGRPVDIRLLFAVKGGPLSMMTTFLCFGGWFLFCGEVQAERVWFWPILTSSVSFLISARRTFVSGSIFVCRSR